MSWFSRRRQYQHSDPEEEYRDALAAWQVDHNADHGDLTADQRKRLNQRYRMRDAGLDPERVQFVRHLVAWGRVSDDA